MASRIEGFDARIIACAKEEFLNKGYADASIRTIAQNAGVSTSTIYTRYSDKEGLFRFLVEAAAEGPHQPPCDPPGLGHQPAFTTQQTG